MNAHKIVNISLKSLDKKYTKSPSIKKWLEFVNGEINRKLLEERVQEKIAESIALGLPLFISDDGKVEVIDIYKNGNANRRKE